LANCPKCDHKLRVIDWKPECPNCGVNVFYYDFEKQFYIDAKGAEIDAAKIRVKWTRIKAALIGSKPAKARLSLCFLPLVATLLAFGSLRIAFPLFDKNISLGTIGLFSIFTDGTFGFLSALQASAVLGEYARHSVNIIFGLCAVTVLALLVMLLQLLCFISLKKMTVLIAGVNALGIIAAVWSIVALSNFSKVIAGGIFTVSNGFGGYAVLAAFLIMLGLNLTVFKKGIKVNYKEGDLYRVEVGRKLKRDEITLDDVTQPVYTPAAAPVETQDPRTGEKRGETDG